MIIKHWQKEEVRKSLLELGAKYANVIGTDINNWRSLWTHLGRGYWIGCWHPNPDGREPRPLAAIRQDGQTYDVTEQFLPPEMTVQITRNGIPGTQTETPNIRIMLTETRPADHVEICPRLQRFDRINAIGHRQEQLIGLPMWVAHAGITVEYEFAPSTNGMQHGTARLEAGESGGPSFADDGGKMYLHGIHRGGGGWDGVLDEKRWVTGVDVWLGHPQVHDWIMSVIGVGEEVKPVEPDVVTVKVRWGQQIHIDWVD